MDDDNDPEVIADIALREQTRRERPGLTDAQFGDLLSKVGKPTILERVPCRNRCGRTADWTAEAEHSFEVFNRELAKRGEAPLDKTRIVFCDTCRAGAIAEKGRNNRVFNDRMAELIRELRGGTTHPEPPGPAPHDIRERQIIKALEAAGHPDVIGLRNALASKRGSKGSPRTKGV